MSEATDDGSRVQVIAGPFPLDCKFCWDGTQMKMMVTRMVGVCLALALAGCATVGQIAPIATVEPRDVRPDPSSGYVAGLDVLYRYRTTVPAVASDFPTLVNIYWSYIPGRDRGMPGQNDYDRMRRLDEELESLESLGAGFVAVCITGNSRREWAFYCQSSKSFLAALNKQLAGESHYPIEIAAAEDPDWRELIELHARIGSA